MKHHAFLILRADNDDSFLENFLKSNLNFKTLGNPDFWQKEIETFGIEDSRELKEVHFRKAFKENGEKVFVVKTKFITHEAQNALLKILEDPTSRSFFFFLLPTKDNLASTLMSRFMILDVAEKKESRDLDFEISYFLKLSPAAKMKTLSKIIESKDKTLALEFLNKLEMGLRENINWQLVTIEEKNIFETISEARSFLRSPSASIKMILENVCLLLPKK